MARIGPLIINLHDPRFANALARPKKSRKIRKFGSNLSRIWWNLCTLGTQSPCQMMIGVYNHLRNARYLGSIAILTRWLDP